MNTPKTVVMQARFGVSEYGCATVSTGNRQRIGIARTAVSGVVLGINLGTDVVDKSQYCCQSMAYITGAADTASAGSRAPRPDCRRTAPSMCVSVITVDHLAPA
jgi:hypothetical protein